MTENQEIRNIWKKLAKSPVSIGLLKDFGLMFGLRIAPIVLLKCCAVVSCMLDGSRISVMHVAPTRQLKSFTSKEVMKRFQKRVLPRFEVGLHNEQLAEIQEGDRDGKVSFRQ